MSKKAIVDFIPVISTHSAAYNNFIARTTGLDSTHLTNYANLLDGLTTDGLFNSDGSSSFFDLFYVFATQDSTTALLNICSSSFTATLNATNPTFTADGGFTGNASGYIKTGWKPGTNGVNYMQNSAGLFGWSNTAGAEVSLLMGTDNTVDDLWPDLGGTFFYASNGGNGSTVNTSATGLFAVDRYDSGHLQGYRNGSTIGAAAPQGSGAPSTTLFLNGLAGSAGNFPSTRQICCMGATSSPGSTNSSNLYSRLRTYMTAVGVP